MKCSAVMIGSLCLLANSAFGAQCSVMTQSVAFADYDFFRPLPVTGIGKILLQCDAQATVRIGLDAGMTSTSDPSNRQMQNDPGAPGLRYNLYLDASYGQIWGDGRAGTSTYRGVTNTGSQSIVIYGRIPPLQNVPAGYYRDSIMMTVEW